jgi:DNA-binding transcriptional LysR family regulator
MTFTQLEIFALVAELRGFTAAAMQLSISQSAVSHAVRSLERELGVELIERQQSGVGLTAIGRQLLGRAREILGLAEAMRQEATDATGLKQGSLRIASFGPTSSLKLLPAILEPFRRQFPGIEVHVDEGADDEVIQWIYDRSVDIGFAVLPQDRFDTMPLLEDQLVALVPASHPLAARRAVAVTDLADFPFIMTAAGCAPLIEPLFAGARVVPRVRYRISQVMTILGMVERGDGVAIIAELALPEKLSLVHPGLVKIPLKPAAKRRIGLAVRDLRQATPAARAFMEVARKLAPRLKFEK